MYTIKIYDAELESTITSAGPIGTAEQIVIFLGNHTDMTYEDREAFAEDVVEHLGTNEQTDLFTGPALKDGRPLSITVTWEG